jgi:hypothetical protein
VWCQQGSLLLCHGLGRHDLSCTAWRRRTLLCQGQSAGQGNLLFVAHSF